MTSPIIILILTVLFVAVCLFFTRKKKSKVERPKPGDFVEIISDVLDDHSFRHGFHKRDVAEVVEVEDPFFIRVKDIHSNHLWLHNSEYRIVQRKTQTKW